MTDNEHTVPTAFSQHLKAFRHRHSLRREDLAEQLGVSIKTIERWEQGKNRPNQDYIITKLSNLLNKSPEDLGLGPANALIQAPSEPSPIPSSQSELSTLTNPLDADEEVRHSSSHNQTQAVPKQSPISPSGPTASTSTHRLSQKQLLLIVVPLVIILVTAAIIAGNRSLQRIQTKVGIVTAPASSCTWPLVNTKSDKSPLVKTIQWMLISPHQSGTTYDLGPSGADGEGGPYTQQAVKDFQHDQHLFPTGLVDTRTWEKLIVPSQLNDTGNSVQALQEQLQNRLALPTLSLTEGVYDQATENAVKTFQRDAMSSQFVTGKADIFTWCRLVGGQLTPFSPLVPDVHANSILQPGESLGPQEQLVSSNHRFLLFLQNTGQLIEEDATNGQILFASPTGNDRRDTGAIFLNQQSDGNIVLIAPGNHAIWATGTEVHLGATLVIENEGNVVVVDTNHRVLWNSFDAL